MRHIRTPAVSLESSDPTLSPGLSRLKKARIFVDISRIKVERNFCIFLNNSEYLWAYFMVDISLNMHSVNVPPAPC